MPQHHPTAERESVRAQFALAAEFEAWAADRGSPVEISTVRQALRFKWECTGGDLHRWTVEDFPRLFGDWLPYRGTTSRRALATLGPTMLAFVDFLGATGRLEPTVPGWWDVRAMVTGLSVWLVDTLTECGQCGVMADRLHARRANIADPAVQERLLVVMARHLVEHFPPPPLEPFLLSWMDPQRVAFRATRWMQPPVYEPSPMALRTAAAAAPAVSRLRQVVRFARRPRTLTVRGHLTRADGAALAGCLGVDELHGARRVSSSTQLEETHLCLWWARAAGLVRVEGRRLAATPLGVSLLDRPLELACHALSALCSVGLPTERVHGTVVPAVVDTPHESLRVLVEALYCATRPLDFGEFTEQIGGLPGPASTRPPEQWARVGGLQRLVRQLEDLDLVTCVGGGAVRSAGGSRRREGGLLTLTTLGTWCVNRLLRADGLPTPVFGEMIDFDAATLLEMCAGYDDEAAAEEARLWSVGRRDGAADEIASAIREAHPGARMSGFAALSGIGGSAEAAVRELLDEPRIRPFALIWLIDHGLESHEAMEAEDVAHMLVEAMVAYLEDDPAKAVYMFARGRDIEDQIADIAHVWRLDNPYAVPLLEAIATRHPNDEVARAARVALRTR